MRKHTNMHWLMTVALILGAGVLGTGCAAWSNMDEETMDSEQPVADTVITGKVMAEVATIEGIDNSDLGVETSNGVVTYSGRVESTTEINQLVAAARRVDGVVDVDTDLLTIVAD